MSTKQSVGVPKWEPKYRNKDGLSTEGRITRSRIKLLTRYPFFGQLALFLELEEVKDYNKVPTAATDGKKLYYNPDFIDSLTDAEVNWVVCHEVLHPALGHLWRRGSRTQKRWNYATDYAIHCIMKEMAEKHPDDFKMPEFCLYDPKYNGKSAEEIYDLLPEEQVISIQGLPGQGTLDSHDMWDQATSSGADAQKQEEEWKGRVISAAKNAEEKSQGSIPGSLKRIIGNLTKPQKDWRQLLAEFIQFEIHDYAFTPPDRRFLYSGLILPDYSEETSVIRNLIFVIDTSGSISEKELRAFLSEGVGLLNQFSNNVTGKVVYADAEVAAVYDINDIAIKPPKGSGGTDFRPTFKWIEEYQDKENVQVCGVVYLTDCYGDFPKQEPNYPVLWVSTTPLSKLENSSYYPPFGQVTELKI